jgi:hypothetical protein
MKKGMIVLLGLALSLPAMVFAQSSQSDDQSQKMQQNQANQASQIDETGVNTASVKHMTGMVSENGKRFTSDNTAYLVGNPKSLQKYDGQTVSVKFQFDPEKNQIHVLSLDQQH